MAISALTETQIPIRSDITGACAGAWDRIAKAGTWFTGAERVAIAQEVRNARQCDLCARRKAALSPYAVEEAHEATGILSAGIVDAVHRITTDPGRLSSRWHNEVLAADVTDAQLVELTGVIGAVTVSDTMSKGVGADLIALPEPQSGEPTRVLPEKATVESAWVPTVQPHNASGEIKDLYDTFGGMVANIRLALSLVPAEAKAFSALHDFLYIDSGASFMDMSYKRSITRPQMELIAAAVSSANDCFY